MQITLQIPDELSVASFGDPSQVALEALAVKAYSAAIFSVEQVREMLNLPSLWEAQEVLSRYGVWPGTTVEDALADMNMLETLRIGA